MLQASSLECECRGCMGKGGVCGEIGITSGLKSHRDGDGKDVGDWRLEICAKLQNLPREMGLCYMSLCDQDTALTTGLIPLLTLHSNSTRKSIARVLTVMNQKQRSNLRELYKGKKHLPLDLRPKQTRAIRRRLTKVSIEGSAHLQEREWSCVRDEWHEIERECHFTKQQGGSCGWEAM